MRIVRDSLGRAEIVGEGELEGQHEVGTLLSKATGVASISPPTPIKFSVTVYEQRRRRLGGALYWERLTDFTGSTPDEAIKKAQHYVNAKNLKIAEAAPVAGDDE